MTVTRADIVAEAREWLGTRWQHQQAVKGLATDCLGLVRGVGVNTGLLPANFMQLPEVQEFLGYGTAPDGRIQRGLALFLQRIPVAEMQPGDVPLMRFEQEPQHVGIVCDRPGGLGIIHAHTRARGRCVVEHDLDATWRARIVAAYAWPGVAA